MTKILCLSDLHLEISTVEIPETDASLIILAGDIAKGNKGVYWAREAFPDKKIAYVIGNHCLYGYQRQEAISLIHIAGKQCDVNILDDTELLLPQENLRILGCTLWTDLYLYGEKTQLRAMHEGQRGLNDFRVIHEGVKGHFGPMHSVELHKKSLAWLIAKLDEPYSGKTIVASHHAPSMLSVSDKYKDDILSACFASNLDYLFGPKIALWCHGHTHTSFDYIVNATRVICNPRGYVTYNSTENFDFNPALVIEI
jgi:Calcineurin-like phosphoesterase